MDIFVLILVLITVWGIRLDKISAPVSSDYFSAERCTAIKGLMAITIVFNHMTIFTDGGYVMPAFAHVGYLVVAVFFFVSGYGLMKKYKSDDKYLDGFILKRVNRIVIPYAIVTGIYWLLSLLMKAPYSAKEVLLSLVNGQPIASNSWYIIVCLLMYAVFWIAAKAFSKKSPILIVLCEVAFCIVWLPFAQKMRYGHWWYTSNLGLPTGMLWAMYEDKIVKFASNTKNYVIIAAASLTLMVTAFAKTYLGHKEAFYIISSVTFAVTLAIVCMKVKIGNPALQFLGRISMEIYLIHGLFNTLFQSDVLYVENEIAYSALVVICTVVAAALLNMLFKQINIKHRGSTKKESANSI